MKQVHLARHELQVLRLTAEGYTSTEISKKLVITPHTVQGYKGKIKDKLGARTPSHAVAIAIREGII